MGQLAADSPNNPHPIPTPEFCDQAASHTRSLSLQLFVKWLFNIDCINPITSLLLQLLCAEDARLLSVWQHRVFSCHRSKSCCAASSVYPAVIGDSRDSSAYRVICKQTGVFHLQKRTTKTKVRVIRTKKKGGRGTGPCSHLGSTNMWGSCCSARASPGTQEAAEDTSLPPRASACWHEDRDLLDIFIYLLYFFFFCPQLINEC